MSVGPLGRDRGRVRLHHSYLNVQLRLGARSGCGGRRLGSGLQWGQLDLVDDVRRLDHHLLRLGLQLGLGLNAMLSQRLGRRPRSLHQRRRSDLAAAGLRVGLGGLEERLGPRTLQQGGLRHGRQLRGRRLGHLGHLDLDLAFAGRGAGLGLGGRHLHQPLVVVLQVFVDLVEGEALLGVRLPATQHDVVDGGRAVLWTLQQDPRVQEANDLQQARDGIELLNIYIKWLCRSAYVQEP